MSRSSIAASMTSSMEVQSVDGSAVPVRSLERSSRLSTSPASRSESSMIASRRSARSSSSIVGEVSASAAARIAVIGVRRSWETVRSRAVLISSLRRRASVSTVAPEQRLAIDSSGEQGLEAGHQAPLQPIEVVRVDAGRDDERSQAARTRGSAAERASPADPSPHRAAAPPRAARAPGDPLGCHRQRDVEAGPAEQRPCQLGHQVGLARRRASASWVRFRASSASVLAIARRDEEGSQRHPVARVRNRELTDRR